LDDGGARSRKKKCVSHDYSFLLWFITEQFF
jgi:hypothetical protein